MLDLKPLSYFVAAYEEGSLTAASKRCHIAQPSISLAIKSLEERLSTSLFSRHKKGLSPTQSAHLLYNKAKALIEHSQQFESQLKLEQPRELKVFVHTDIQLDRFESFFQQWKTNITNLSLTLVDDINQSDIAFVIEEYVGDNWGKIDLESERYFLAIPVNHALANKPYLELEDLHGLPIVERPYCPKRIELANAFTSLNIEPSYKAQAQNDQQLCQLIKLGFGVGFIPEWSFKQQSGLDVKSFSTETYTDRMLFRNIVLAYRRSKHIVENFIDPLAI